MDRVQIRLDVSQVRGTRLELSEEDRGKGVALEFCNSLLWEWRYLRKKCSSSLNIIKSQIYFEKLKTHCLKIICIYLCIYLCIYVSIYVYLSISIYLSSIIYLSIYLSVIIIYLSCIIYPSRK